MCLFADDTAIYPTLENKGDSGKLQRGLDRLPTLEARWDKEIKSMQRSGTEEIRTEIQPSIPKWEITKITNSQNAKRT